VERFTPDEVILALPPTDTVIQELTIPVVDGSERDEMVSLQAVRRTALPPEDFVRGDETLETTADGLRVRLAFARRADVAARLRTLDEAGIHVSRVVPAVTAWEGSLGRRLAERELALAWWGDAPTQLVLFHGPRVVLCRPMPAADAAGELTRTLAVRPEWRDARLFASPDAPPPGIDAARAEPLSTSSFAEGAAVSDGGPDLTPEDRRAERERRRLGHRRRAAALLGIAVVALAVLTSAGLRRRDDHRLAALRAEWARWGRDTETLRSRQDALDALNAHRRAPGTLTALLDGFSDILPARARLTSLRFEREQSLVIQGAAGSLTEVTALMEALSRRPGIGEVALRSSDAPPGADAGSGVRFEIEARLAPNGRAP
jgi:Tfp pilus assembly protein PilN